MSQWIFGYGSLMFEPELARHVVESVPARLLGHRRRFNKLSTNRWCPAAESFDAFPPPRPDLVRDGAHRSIVLGTEEAEEGVIEGRLLRYETEVWSEVLRVTDLREGYAPDRPLEESGYLRREVRVERTDRTEDVLAVTYLSNPDTIYRSDLTLEDTARAVINATPQRRRDDSDSRGLHYLEGSRAVLRRAGLIDPELEALAAAVRSFPGPWVELVSPPTAQS
ncbi:MAG: gamma-glutamylcyclotransferase [Acidobacteriota bacterium]